MKITNIRASAGRTVPHPHMEYSNLKFFVEMTAELQEGDLDEQSAAASLQESVDNALSRETEKRLQQLEIQYREEQERLKKERAKQRAIYEAEAQLRDAERNLERLKNDEAAETEDMPF